MYLMIYVVLTGHGTRSTCAQLTNERGNSSFYS